MKSFFLKKNFACILIFEWRNWYYVRITMTRNYIMRTHNSDLGRRSPRGGRVLCREFVPIRHFRSSGHTVHHVLLIWHLLYVAGTGGPVVEFRLLHIVVIGSISSGGDHSVHCWLDLIVLIFLGKVCIQLFSP